MKKYTFKLTVSTLLVSLLFVTGTQSSSANNELKNRLDQVREKQEENQFLNSETTSAIEELEEQLSILQNELATVSDERDKNSEDIEKNKTEILELEDDISRLQDEINLLSERIKERTEILKDRAIASYESDGGISYLEVLLGSKSFGDFIERVSVINTIAQSDQEIIDEQIEDQEKLISNEKELELNKSELETKKVSLEEIEREIANQINQINNINENLRDKESKLIEKLNEIVSDEELLRKQEVTLNEQIIEFEEQEKERIAKEEQERKEKEEREERLERQEQERIAAEKKVDEENKQNSNQNSEPVKQKRTENSQTQPPKEDIVKPAKETPSAKNESAQAPAQETVNSTSFVRPTTGRMTSEYGQRWGRMHWGMDIGKNGRSGDIPIVAAYEGTVVSAEYHPSFGNWILVSHQIDGKQVTTVYAHLDRLDVKAGQKVARGESMGIMGNTGDSTGPHLHFEVHEGSFNWSRSNAVNPNKYI
ncbi:peptidoglycan DD-metalloendopeptidase family protein [Shouchella sp. 1P09AA]|uniref:murein hydrolase activator EnvC family protein n=1 Tax=unclassified Shouchella TaxID=2893065 RepID=UPI0039A2F1E2